MAQNDDQYRGILKKYGSVDHSQLWYDSREASRRVPNNSPKNDVSDNMATVLNQMGSHNPFVTDSLGIYKRVNPGSQYQNHSQAAIEGFANLTEGDNVLFYDTEILGTFNGQKSNSMKWFQPTEISVIPTRFINGQLQKTGSAYSYLVKPSMDTHARINQLINNVAAGKWIGMTDDERRTLSDLTLYEGDRDSLFETSYVGGRQVTKVRQQNRTHYPLSNSVLSRSDTISRMRAGLNNLMEFGTDPDTIVSQLNGIMSSTSNLKLAGYNVYNFDQKMMLQYLHNRMAGGQIDTPTKRSYQTLMDSFASQQIDVFSAIKTFYKDPANRFGYNNKLDRISQVLGIHIGTSHQAVSDTDTTIGLANYFLGDPGVKNLIERKGNYWYPGSRYGSWDPNPVKVGDVLFARKGIRANEYDAVLRQGADGSYSSAYGRTNIAGLFKNSTYKVQRYFNGLPVNGQAMYGVELLNQDEGTIHTIMRPSKMELEDAMHGTLVPANSITMDQRLTAMKYRNQDRAMRAWRKAFYNEDEQGHGINRAVQLYKALDVAQATEEKLRATGITTPSDIDERIRDAVANATEKNSPAFVRDFMTMRERLEKEARLYVPFINRLDPSLLQGTRFAASVGAIPSSFAGTGDVNALKQSTALAYYTRMLNQQLGVNEGAVRLPGSARALKTNVGGSLSYIHMTDPDTVKSGLFNALYKGHVGRPNVGVLEPRFRQLLGELESQSIISGTKLNSYMALFHSQGQGGQIDNLMTDLSNSIMRAREMNPRLGVTWIHGEKVNGVNKTSTRLKNTDRAFKSGLIESIQEEALRTSGTLSGLGKGKLNFPEGSPISNLFNEYNASVVSAFQEAGFKPNSPIDITKATKAQSSLTELAQAYISKGMNVQIHYDPEHKGLYMALASKDTSEAVLNGTLGDLMANNQVAVVHLPTINSDGTISYGSQNRVSRPIVVNNRGRYEMQMPWDEVMSSLKRQAGSYAKQLARDLGSGNKNTFIQMENGLNRTINRTLQNLSMNSHFMNNNSFDSMTSASGSRMANWLRGQTVDINAFAEEWYREWVQQPNVRRKARDLGLTNPDEIKRNMGYNTFADSMGVSARRSFQRNVDQWLKDKGYLDVDMHSVGNTQVANFMRSTSSAQQLLPFGFFDPMARENIRKSVNYHFLDPMAVRARLREQRFNSSAIDRILTRSLVTDKAQQVAGDELGYLNLRTVQMGDDELAKEVHRVRDQYLKEAKLAHEANDIVRENKYSALANSLKNMDKFATYEGMSVISDDVQQAFEVEREKHIHLTQGSKLSNDMLEILNRGLPSGQKFDPSQSMVFEHGINLFDSTTVNNNPNRTKMITVSDIAKSDGSQKAMDVYKNWNPYVKVKGWNAETQTLTLSEITKPMNGTKFVTTTGLRITGTGMPRQAIEDITGLKGIDAIIPHFETKKEQWGTQLDSVISLAVDEAKRQLNGESQGALTAGKIALPEALETIAGIARKNFGINSKQMVVQNGQLVLDHLFGVGGNTSINIGNYASFTKEIDRLLGTNFTNPTTPGRVVGMAGFGLQDIENWENSIGYIPDGTKGLVNYGPKELDMVLTRANAILGGGNAYSKWLSSYHKQIASAQNEGVDKYFGALAKGVIERGSETPTAGDIIIRTTGSQFEHNPMTGEEIGRVLPNGVREISMNALNPLPEITTKNQVMTPGDYKGTIVDYGRAKGHFGDGMTYEEGFVQNGGRAMLELPDRTFSQQYIRLADKGSIADRSITDNVLMTELEKTQKSIYRDIRSYQDLGKSGTMSPGDREEERIRLHDKIEAGMAEYNRQSEKLLTSSRTGSIEKTLGTAKLGMSGRFRSQGVNPFSNYEQDAQGNWHQVGDYKEGTVYIQRERAREMLFGEGKNEQGVIERNIMKNVIGKDIAGMSNRQMQEHILDYMETTGLYGMVNRYPTINQATLQAMKVQIDPTMAANDRGIRGTVGTLTRLHADYDGDFLSVVMAHYSHTGAGVKEVHSALEQMQQEEVRTTNASLNGTLNDILGDSKNLNAQFRMTPGDLAKKLHDIESVPVEKRNSEQAEFMHRFSGWVARTSEMDTLESVQARTGAEFIGFVDNTRQRIIDLASATYDTIGQEGSVATEDLAKRRSLVEEFGRAFSQDSISAKKFTVDSIAKEQAEAKGWRLGGLNATQKSEVISATKKELEDRYLYLDIMNRSVNDPNRSGSRESFMEANQHMNIFKDQDALDAMWDEIAEVDRLTGTGRRGGLKNASLNIGRSEGTGNRTQDILTGKSGPIVPTKAIEDLKNLVDDAQRENIDKQIGSFQNNIIMNLNGESGHTGLLDAITNHNGTFIEPSQTLSQATIGRQALSEAGEAVAKLIPKHIGGGGMVAGVLGFAGAWIASATLRPAPTPESNRNAKNVPTPEETVAHGFQTVAANIPQPTARITPNSNGQHISMQVSASNPNGVSQDQIAARTHQAMRDMTSAELNMNLNVNDNTQNIDREWLQNVVAHAINNGMGF